MPTLLTSDDSSDDDESDDETESMYPAEDGFRRRPCSGDDHTAACSCSSGVSGRWALCAACVAAAGNAAAACRAAATADQAATATASTPKAVPVVSPQTCLQNEDAVSHCEAEYTKNDCGHMEKSERLDVAWTCVTKCMGLMEQSSMRGCSEILSFIFKVNLLHGAVNRALTAQAKGQKRRRKPGKQQYYPLDAEVELVRRIKVLRSQKLPVYPFLCMAMANGLIRGTPYEKTFEKTGGVTPNWYRRFRCSPHAKDLVLCSPNPHEENRNQWCTAINARQHFTVLQDVIIRSGIGHVNPGFEANTPMSEPVIIDKPSRMASFDETHLHLTGTKNVGRKKTLCVKGKNGQSTSRDMIVNKCSANLTQVGGSAGDGKALPQMAIVPGKSLDPLITKNSPKSHFVDENNESGYLTTIYSANESGGMTDDMGAVYLDKVIFPALKPTMEDPMILICDGHGSHLTYSFLQKCHGEGETPIVYLVLRPPHTSHRLQCEDVINFAVYKPLVAKKRTAVFMQRVLAKNCPKSRNLNLRDTNEISADAWEKSFSEENNLKAWSVCGLIPFTRRPMWDLHEEEKAVAETMAGHDSNQELNIDYTQISFEDMLEDDENEEQSGDEGAPAPCRLPLDSVICA